MQHVVVLCGGQSSEYSVSLVSAKNVAQQLGAYYRVTVVLIQPSGKWVRVLLHDLLKVPPFEPVVLDGPHVTFVQTGTGVVLMDIPGKGHSLSDSRVDPVNVVFPMLHGPMGEDGTIQGWLEFLGVPYVGCEALSSALCMDKVMCKRVLSEAKIPVVPWLTLSNTTTRPTYEACCDQLGATTLFVKSAVMGSAIGVSKVTSSQAWGQACDEALRYSEFALVEKAVMGQEIECAVLGNHHPKAATCVGEIKPAPRHGFYTYEAKYLDPEGAQLCVPASLSQPLVERVRTLAVQAYTTLGCMGMARVDFFVTSQEEIFLNEVNTIPGFTSISLYPKMWEYSGLSQQDLVHTLVQLALERFQTKTQLLKAPPLPSTAATPPSPSVASSATAP